MGNVFCFGELLLRLSPSLHGAWIRQHSMPVYLGGAELNVAMALANWNIPVTYCTALPDNSLSKDITAYLQHSNINTAAIQFSGDRIGVYYLPQGVDLKNAGVIYDRAYSSFSSLKPGCIDWERLLQSVSWFHFSAICPALNENSAAVCKEALEVAQKNNITISVDLNYRAKLWQYGKQPIDIMPQLAQYCDVIMGNIWALENMLGIPLPKEFNHSKESFLQQAAHSSNAVMQNFKKCKQVANTFRFDDREGVHYYSTLYTDQQLYLSKEYYSDAIVDKAGSGDCFMAGLIYSDYHKSSPQETIEFAAAAAFKKLLIAGDATTSSVEEIKQSYLNHA